MRSESPLGKLVRWKKRSSDPEVQSSRMMHTLTSTWCPNNGRIVFRWKANYGLRESRYVDPLRTMALHSKAIHYVLVTGLVCFQRLKFIMKPEVSVPPANYCSGTEVWPARPSEEWLVWGVLHFCLPGTGSGPNASPGLGFDHILSLSLSLDYVLDLSLGSSSDLGLEFVLVLSLSPSSDLGLEFVLDLSHSSSYGIDLDSTISPSFSPSSGSSPGHGDKSSNRAHNHMVPLRSSLHKEVLLDIKISTIILDPCIDFTKYILFLIIIWNIIKNNIHVRWLVSNEINFIKYLIFTYSNCT